MSNNLATLISALGAGYAGYVKGTQQEEDRAQEREARAQEMKARQFQIDEAQQKQNLKRDIAKSQQDIAVENGTTTTGTNLYADPQAAADDAREMAMMNRQAAENTGTAPAALPAPAPISRVGAQTFTDPKAAAMAAQGVNSQQAKMERAADVAAKAGDIDQATKFQEYAKKHLDEGTDKVLAHIAGTATPLEQLKANGGAATRAIDPEVADVFNKTGGKYKVNDKTTVQDFIDKDPYGNEFVNSRVIDENGKPIVNDVRTASQFLLSMKDRMALKQDEAKAGFEVKKEADNIADKKEQRRITEKHYDQTFQIEQGKAGEEARHHRAVEGISASAAKRAEALQSDQFKKQSLEGQIGQVEAALGRKLDPKEREDYVGRLSGFTKAGGAAPNDALVKFNMDIVKKGVDNGTIPIEKANDKLAELNAAPQLMAAKATITSTMQAMKPDTKEYAEAYTEAAGKVGEARMKEWGLVPPKIKKDRGPLAASSGAGAAAQGIPSAPPQFTQQGLSRVPNPAYADYVRQYGAQLPAAPDPAAVEAQRQAELERARRYNPFNPK